MATEKGFHPMSLGLARPLALALTLALWPTAALAAPGFADEAEAKKAFLASPSGRHIEATGHQVDRVIPLNDREVLVVDYVPEQGALSHWDNEARLVLYNWSPTDGFVRKQFVSKAGDSLKGGLGGLTIADMDGDGLPEVLAVSKTSGNSGRVVTMVFKRFEAGGKYRLVWMRKEPFAAAKMLEGNKLLYTYTKRSDRSQRLIEEVELSTIPLDGFITH